MLKRTLTAIVGIAVLLPVIAFSNTFVLPTAVAFFILIALIEMFRCIGFYKNFLLTVPFYVIGVLSPFAMRYLWKDPTQQVTVFLLAMIIIMLYELTITVFSKGNLDLSKIASSFFVSVYIIFAFSGIIYLRDCGNDYVYLLVFIMAWLTDIFAYLTGMLLGKHKLIPEISPKKTVEGSIGGVVVSTAVFVILSKLLPILELSNINIILLIMSGIIMSFVAQIGDLCMSAIKRQFEIKDFGKLFPGHGGVLDRFDSVLAVSAVMTILFSIIK